MNELTSEGVEAEVTQNITSTTVCPFPYFSFLKNKKSWPKDNHYITERRTYSNNDRTTTMMRARASYSTNQHELIRRGKDKPRRLWGERLYTIYRNL